MKRLLTLILALGVGTAWGARFLDEGDSAFFPPAFEQKLSLIKSFPTTWWNFLVVEAKEGTTRAQVLEVCRDLVEAKLVDRLDCSTNLGQFTPALNAWAADLPLRKPAPTREELRRAFDASLAQASLPLPAELMALLRLDPFQNYKELEAHVRARLPLNLPREDGLYFDAPTRRWVIPVRPAFSPADGARFDQLAGKVFEKIPESRAAFLGPHASARENRAQIQNDLNLVSVLGSVLMGALLAFVLITRRYRLLWGVPLVAAGVGTATAVTVLLFGSIHGLVLSFGVGIVGLTLDYGIHAAFNSDDRTVWYANLIGIATTVAAFMVLSFSAIPLIRQLAVFSITGLGVSFALVYFAHRRFSAQLSARPFDLVRGRSPWWPRLVGVLTLGLLPLAFLARPSFDMKRFDFQSPRTQALYAWLGGKLKFQKPLFEIMEPTPEAGVHEQSLLRYDWARNFDLELENSAFYFPPAYVQESNLAEWRKDRCPAPRLVLSEKDRVFFAPFLAATACERLQPRALSADTAYLADFHAQGRWLNLWLPRDEREREAIVKAYPQSFSLLDLVNEFPKTIARELAWMTPLCFLVILAILWAHLGRLSVALVALFPFAAALGTLGWAVLCGMPLTFISLVGVILLLGLGVDYGIFAVDDALAERKAGSFSREHDNRLTSSILCAAVTTVLGYLPLAFCQHQVLAQLGQVLTLGTLGSTVGALWGIPVILRRLK